MPIQDGTDARRTQEGDLVLTQLRELIQAVTRLLGRVRVLEREVRDLRRWALRCGAIVGEDL